MLNNLTMEWFDWKNIKKKKIDKVKDKKLQIEGKLSINWYYRIFL